MGRGSGRGEGGGWRWLDDWRRKRRHGDASISHRDAESSRAEATSHAAGRRAASPRFDTLGPRILETRANVYHHRSSMDLFFLSFFFDRKKNSSAFSSLVQNPSPPKFKGEKNLSKAPFRDCINLIRSMERIRVLIVNSDFDHFVVIMSFLR